ncbi:MAG: hypothetical protein JNK11_19295 [Alphaproteobacteria bacterium]|nr:hypothetical protein [Alphaproteobacteria bacterium]
MVGHRSRQIGILTRLRACVRGLALVAALAISGQGLVPLAHAAMTARADAIDRATIDSLCLPDVQADGQSDRQGTGSGHESPETRCLVCLNAHHPSCAVLASGDGAMRVVRQRGQLLIPGDQATSAGDLRSEAHRPRGPPALI